MKREVKILEDGTPETITLPRGDQFVPGAFSEHGRCGCLLGHAYYAFGCEVNKYTVGGEVSVALRFARDVLYELGADTDGSNIETFDNLCYDRGEVFGDEVAHAWRVVADRWGYDVRASEPEWKP